MYKLFIYINSDGDFSYKNPIFQPDDCEHEFFFEERIHAIKILKRIMVSLKETISTSKGYDFSSFKKFADLTCKISNKFPTFMFEHELGNQSICVSLQEILKVNIEDGFFYDSVSFDYEFWGMDQYDFKVLDEIPDL